MFQNKTLKISAWNVNGIRSVISKEVLQSFIDNTNPDILCLSELKLPAFTHEKESKFEELLDKILQFKRYPYRYHNTAMKNGYSGTAIWSKYQPLKMFAYRINTDTEGRVTVAEFEKFFILSVYTPNSGCYLDRLSERCIEWDPVFREYIRTLSKPVIVAGDLNCAHLNIDIHNKKLFNTKPGLMDQERWSFANLLQEGKLIDSYRYKYPSLEGKYTYWSYQSHARVHNKGWRIDYILLSSILQKHLLQSIIHDEQGGSDHCPISIILNNI